MPAVSVRRETPWHVKPAAHWRGLCRGWDLAGGRVKLAELGGGQDVPFEQAFSNLAHSYVKDKAPKLLDYEVGFQLLEKNQENTKAVGIFGFKVGSQWLYAPVFFLNGDLKGHELLYIKSQDAFVPMSEAWINWLLGRKPSVLGEAVPRNLSRIGVMPPSLYQLSRSPNKFASDKSANSPESGEGTCAPAANNAPYYCPKCGCDWHEKTCAHCGGQKKKIVRPKLAAWAVDAVGALAHVLTTPIDTTLRLEGFLKEAGAEAVRALLEGCRAYPWLAGEVDRYYGADFLERMTKEAHSAACRRAAMRKRRRGSSRRVKMSELLDEKQAAKGNKGVRVITFDEVYAQGVDVIHDLSKDEKEKVVKERVVVKDTRDDEDVTIAFNATTELALRNPDKTSVYEVLVKPDEFEKCLVLMAPYGSRDREVFCVVVRLDGEHRWVNSHPSRVWVRSTYDDEAFRKWVAGLPSADSLREGRSLQMIIGKDGSGTCPFRVREHDSGEASDTDLYRVSFRDYARHDRAGWLPKLDNSYRERYDYDNYGPDQIRLTGKLGARLRLSNAELWVPDGFKKLVLKKPPDPKKEKEDDGLPMFCCNDSSDPGPLELGNALDLHLLLAHHTTPLRLFADGKDVVVDHTRMDKTSAVVHLVRDLGLREKQARACVAAAESAWARSRSAADFRLLKRAAPGEPIGDMVRGAPGAPPFPDPYIGADDIMGSNVPTIQDSDQRVHIPDMSAARTDRSIYDPRVPDPRSMAVAQQAARTGQKEVFDTAALGGLLSSVRPDNMVDRYLGDMMKGMDRTGRVLFNFYWHGEEFEDRYGKQDMPELEDGLRNSFEGQGDIILKLKQKMVDSDPGEGMQVDLSNVANS